jgi:hypothetical protein
MTQSDGDFENDLLFETERGATGVVEALARRQRLFDQSICDNIREITKARGCRKNGNCTLRSAFAKPRDGARPDTSVQHLPMYQLVWQDYRSTLPLWKY